ncbi:hypothetical protein P0D75_38990, partial [Paraburkholderia sediminicola]
KGGKAERRKGGKAERRKGGKAGIASPQAFDGPVSTATVECRALKRVVECNRHPAEWTASAGR